MQPFPSMPSFLAISWPSCELLLVMPKLFMGDWAARLGCEVCGRESGVYVDDAAQRRHIAIAKTLQHIPSWEIGDNTVRGLGRRRMAKLRLRLEDHHIVCR
jgi:hypothetical protein